MYDLTQEPNILLIGSDMRRAYLRVGGHDPVTMSRLTELEVRAIELRNARHRQQRASVDERERGR